MTFRKYERVMIFNGSELHGKVATVMVDAGNQIKVEVPGMSFLWYKPKHLRKIHSEGYDIPDIGAPVKVVKPSFNKGEVKAGACGYLTWKTKQQMLVEIGRGSYYFEAGDVIQIPKTKKAWFIFPDEIRYDTANFCSIREGCSMWKDSRDYMFLGNLVKDSLNEALDSFKNRTGKKRIKINYDKRRRIGFHN